MSDCRWPPVTDRASPFTELFLKQALRGTSNHEHLLIIVQGDDEIVLVRIVSVLGTWCPERTDLQSLRSRQRNTTIQFR